MTQPIRKLTLRSKRPSTAPATLPSEASLMPPQGPSKTLWWPALYREDARLCDIAGLMLFPPRYEWDSDQTIDPISYTTTRTAPPMLVRGSFEVPLTFAVPRLAEWQAVLNIRIGPDSPGAPILVESQLIHDLGTWRAPSNVVTFQFVDVPNWAWTFRVSW